jgi:choline dehydrogenase-like flavoprotein
VSTPVETEVLVIGSGAGGAVTAARLAEAGRSVLVVEEGPWVEPGSVEPFSLEEMVTSYRHQGASAALGTPGIAFAEGRCVGGSTEINSGLHHRLPTELAEQWRQRYAIAEFGPATMDHYASEVERLISVAKLPGPPPASSAILDEGANKLGWRAVEFARLWSYPGGRSVKQTMARTFIPRALEHGAEVVAECTVTRLLTRDDRVVGVTAQRRRPDGSVEPLEIHAEHVVVSGGAIQTPTLLQRSGIRANIGNGLKFHPTVKVAARFDHVLDHDEVPVHRITEFAPHLTIGGSASRRGHVALAIADAASGDIEDALSSWDEVVVYYAAIRSAGSGRVIALPGLRAPLVTYRLTDADMSRLARGLVHLGEALLAAGAIELYPSIAGGPVVRSVGELVGWWDALSRTRANLMTVHLTSSVRMGEDRSSTGADSFGRIWGYRNLRVNDASLLPDAPGVNPQAAIMAISLRNADQFLTEA